jgi:hypothetical protein
MHAPAAFTPDGDDAGRVLDSSSTEPRQPSVSKGPSAAALSLAQAQEAARRGDLRLAHDICVRLIGENPSDEQAWLWRAGTAESIEESIAALSHVLTLNPTHPVARRGLYEAMNRLLRRDAFLAYLGETGQFYHVRTPANLAFAHPKDRAQPEPFPPAQPWPAQPAFRWLGWALVGLIPAGLGAVICAPLAMLAAIRLLRRQPNRADRFRAWLVFGLAVALWLLGLILLPLVILHLV